MKRQNTTAIFLLAAMLTASLVSCGDSTGETKTTDALTQTTETAAVTEPAEYIAPEVDYGGETFTFFTSRYEGNYKLCAYDGITADGEAGDIINDAMHKRNLAVEESLNVKLAAFSDPWLQPLINSTLANDNAYDAAIIGQYKCNSLLGNEGYLYDLTDLDTLNLGASWVNQNVNEIMNINDSQFIMLSDVCMYSMLSGACLYFSKSLVETNQLDDPYQMVYDGKWTLDNFIGLSKQVSADLNGDGVYDQHDSFGMNGSPTVMAACVRSSDILATDLSDITAPKIILNNEKTANVIDKLTGLLSNEQVNLQPDKLRLDKTADVWYDIILPMFKNNQLLFTFNWVFYALELRDMDTDFGILPMPKYDENQKQYRSFVSDTWTDVLCVPVSVADADRIGHVLNASGYYSQQYLYPEVINRTVMDKTIRDDAAADMLDLIFRNTLLDANDFYVWDSGNIYNIWEKSVTGKSNALASQFERLEKSMQSKLEKTVEYLSQN